MVFEGLLFLAIGVLAAAVGLTGDPKVFAPDGLNIDVVWGLVMAGFGMVLEGAPALILFGPLLTPIAVKLGVNPLQFGTIMVIAMGLGFFAPPIGVGLFATVAMTGTRMASVVRPMMKYMAVLLVALLALILAPEFSLWLPRLMGLSP